MSMFTQSTNSGGRQAPAPPASSRTRRVVNRQSPPPIAGPSTGVGLGTSTLGGTGLFGNIGGRDKPGYSQQRAGTEQQQREREREHLREQQQRQQQQQTGTSGSMELNEEQKAEINEAVSILYTSQKFRTAKAYRIPANKLYCTSFISSILIKTE